MEQLRSIAVGVDVDPAGASLSSGSLRAIEQALWLTERSAARLTLVHATALDRYFDPIGGNTVVVGVGPREEVLDQMLELVDRAEDQGIDCELVLDGRPADEALPDRAVRANADLLLVGKRSTAERDGRRLGRVSKRLIRTASVPVWVTSADHVGPVKTIVAATDFSAVGNHAAAGAAWLARLFRADLHVVHAVPLEFLPAESYAATEVVTVVGVERSARMQGARQRLDELCASLAVDATPHVLDRPPYDALSDFVLEKQADLLALGTASRHGIAGFLVGNTAEWLVDSVGASLLAFPPPRPS
jgi:nucleotide-binding universal stress UspA family protein